MQREKDNNGWFSPSAIGKNINSNWERKKDCKDEEIGDLKLKGEKDNKNRKAFAVVNNIYVKLKDKKDKKDRKSSAIIKHTDLILKGEKGW